MGHEACVKAGMKVCAVMKQDEYKMIISSKSLSENWGTDITI
jgi:hypothetical protein